MTAVASETSQVETLNAYVDGLTDEEAIGLLITAVLLGVDVPGPDDEGINSDVKVALKVAVNRDTEAFAAAVEFAKTLGVQF